MRRLVIACAVALLAPGCLETRSAWVEADGFPYVEAHLLCATEARVVLCSREPEAQWYCSDPHDVMRGHCPDGGVW